MAKKFNVFIGTFSNNLKRYLESLPRSEKIALIILIQLALLAPLVPSAGWDFIATFRRETLSGAYGTRTFNPYPAYWVFQPFMILPPRLGFFLWNVVAVLGYIVALRHFKGKVLPFTLSIACFWTLYIGQIEGLMSLGLVLGLVAGPFGAGLGLFLLTIKPQIGLFSILFILFQRRDYRLLLVPATIYFASLIFWGWWIPDWIESIISRDLTGNPSNISIWPYGLVLLPLLFYRPNSLRIWLLVQSLILPYFPIYSLAILFTMYVPNWANIAFWLLYILASYYPLQDFAFIIPLLMLIQLFWREQKTRNSSIRHNKKVFHKIE
ncbi:MAG: glycosyltransferase family 87 protein [Chloroflexota bacterium]